MNPTVMATNHVKRVFVYGMPASGSSILPFDAVVSYEAFVANMEAVMDELNGYGLDIPTSALPFGRNSAAITQFNDQHDPWFADNRPAEPLHIEDTDALVHQLTAPCPHLLRHYGYV